MRARNERVFEHAFAPSQSTLERLLELTLLNTQLEHVENSSSLYRKQVVWLQLITISWICVEAAFAIFAAVRAHSVALLGFGVNSGIELLSTLVVLLLFMSASHLNEKSTARITGLLLFGLAAFILGDSIVAFASPWLRPEPTYLGIGLLIAAAIVMPRLAGQKRALATRAGR